MGIVAGSDGALWFAERGGNRIGRITTAGAITEFVVTTFGDLFGIAAGADGALWFTKDVANTIGRITTAGAITEFPLPSANSQPLGIAAGPDGALWFTENVGNRMGRITTAGAITEFVIPTAASDSRGVTAGPDGALWFTEATGNRIGRITTAGAITEFPLPSANSRPKGIAAGPDGALWFTEDAANRIGRIAPPQPIDFKLSLNGTTAYAEAPHADELNTTGSWTVEAWFRDFDPAGFDHPRARMLAKGDTAGPEVPYLVGIERNGLFAGLRAGWDAVRPALRPAAQEREPQRLASRGRHAERIDPGADPLPGWGEGGAHDPACAERRERPVGQHWAERAGERKLLEGEDRRRADLERRA